MYLFFDVETNGLPRNYKAPVSDIKNWPRIVQISWIVYNIDEVLIKENDFIVKPLDFQINISSTKIHGITQEYAISNGGNIYEILEAFISDLIEVSYVIAHNLDFDQKVILSECFRHKLNASFKSVEKICTMKESTDFCAIPSRYGYKWPSLSALYQKLFSIPFEGQHNSLFDVKATSKSFWELKRRGIIEVNLPIQRNWVSWYNNLSEKWQLILSVNLLFTLQKYDKRLLRIKLYKYNKSSFEKIRDENIELFEGLDIEKIANLEYISLNGFEVTSLDNLIPLNKLKEIYAYDNIISDLSALKKMHHLKVLRLRKNRFVDISPIKNLAHLENLDIAENEINNIFPINEMSKLKVLFLSKCNITEITPLKEMYNLQELYIDWNHIKDISALSDLKELKKIHLGVNEISDLMPLHKLKKLEILWTTDPVFDIYKKNETEFDFKLRSNNNISEHQITALKSLLPDCKFNSIL